MTSKQKGTCALVAAAILSGSLGVFSHYINFNIPLFYQMSVRNIFQLIILVALIFLPIGKKKSVAKKDWKWFALRSVSGFINTLGLYVAFTRISIGSAYFLSFAAATVCGYSIGSLLFKEHIDRRSLAALALSVIGLSLIYSVTFETSTLWYGVAAIAAGIAAPGWSVFSKFISKSYSNLQMNLIDSAIAVGLSVGMSRIYSEKWIVPEWNGLWIATFALAFILLLAALLTVYGFKHMEAQTGTLLLLLEVVAGIILGYIFYRQAITFTTAIGGMLILVAVYVRTRSKLQFIDGEKF